MAFGVAGFEGHMVAKTKTSIDLSFIFHASSIVQYLALWAACISNACTQLMMAELRSDLQLLQEKLSPCQGKQH